MYKPLQLTSEIWDNICYYLPKSSLVSLLWTSRDLRKLVLPKLYQHALFNEWGGQGLKLASAIFDGIPSKDLVESIQVAEIALTTREEATAMISAFSAIAPQLTNLHTIVVCCYNGEDAVWAANRIAEHYPDTALEIYCKAVNSMTVSCSLSPTVLRQLKQLTIPYLLRSVLKKLTSLETLQVGSFVHDDVSGFAELPVKLGLSYTDWIALNCPHTKALELDLVQNYIYMLDPQSSIPNSVQKKYAPRSEITVNSSTVEDLKLIGFENSGKINPDPSTEIVSIRVVAPALRVLILSNLPSVVVESLFQSSKVPRVECLIVSPITVSALQGISDYGFKHLQLVMAIVTEASFKKSSPKELELLVRWIQRLALTCPMDMRDLTKSINPEIYFGEGMWCTIAQTPFAAYLPDAVSSQVRSCF